MPAWVPRTSGSRLEVCFSPSCEAFLRSDHQGALLDGEALRLTLSQSLQADPRPLYRWRREQGKEGGEYTLQIDGVTATCCFDEHEDGSVHVRVTRLIRS